MATKKQLIANNILTHAFRLNEYFGVTPEPGNVLTLSKALFRMETKVHKLAENYCNGVIPDMPEYDDKLKDLLIKHGATKNVDKVFINQDPRGYALKINLDIENDSSEFYFRDWGGYGVLAPDFREV